MSDSERVEFVTEWCVWPTGCPLDDPEASQFQVRVQWRGEGRWRVECRGQELSRAGNWSWHVQPFQRHQYRWDSFEEAQGWARLVVDDVKIGRFTYAAWQEHWKAKRAAQVKE